MKVAIIGGGHMGLVLGRAFLTARRLRPNELLLVERDQSQLQSIAAQLENCGVQNEINAALRDYAVIILAVKPQDAAVACAGLALLLSAWSGEKPLIISIMAGISVNTLQKLLGGHQVIVRSMPNLAAKAGLSMTAYFAAPAVDEKQRKLTEELFNAAGKSLSVGDEALIDAVTAVSGSGPAYFFYFIEHMLEAARKFGFSEAQSEILVSQTMRGALELWTQSKIPPRELRKQVTSKGGTTAAAIAVFEEKKIGESLQDGMEAARKRAKELSAGWTPLK